MEKANKNGITIVLGDGCRDNPFADRVISGTTRGLVKVEAGFGSLPIGKGTGVILATQADGRSYDALPGEPHSPFAAAVGTRMVEAGVEWLEFARRVQSDVIDKTKGEQKPEIISSLSREFYFVPHRKDGPTAAPAHNSLTRAARAFVENREGELKPTYDGSYALLIGVSEYKNPAWRNLPGVKKDIDEVEAALKQVHGFEVTKVLDPDYRRLDDAFRTFIATHGAKSNARLVIYFAGHGYTTDSGSAKVGWLVPTDAPSYRAAPELFSVTALSLRRVQEHAEIIQAKHVLWVFDSCFAGAAIGMVAKRSPDTSPFEKDRLGKRVRRIIASGSENEEVPDKSVFAELFVSALRGRLRVGSEARWFTGNELGTFLTKHVIDETTKRSSRKQTPQSDTVVIPLREEGDIIFRIEEELTKVAKQ
jgi:uncharacterized caspase-like protein